MDIQRIRQLLAHRYPFLLIDRVLEYQVGETIIAQKNITINEPFFQGHFPEMPVMPGVLVLEAMAQAAGLLAMETAPETVDSLYYLVAIDKARFKQPVIPGDQLILEIKLNSQRRGFWKFSGVAKVDNKVVASAELICSPKD